MQEKNFQTLFNKFLAEQEGLPFSEKTSAFELKLVKAPQKSLPFDAVKPHQIRALKLAKKKLIYKISDTGHDQKPFDCFQLVKAQAYVVVLFYTPYANKFVILIEVDDFIKEKESSKRKSLTEERAWEIGLKYVL